MARILVVGADATSSPAVARHLEGAGFLVERVADGRLALERVASKAPDVIVIDLVPPRAAGLEVYRRLRGGSVPVNILGSGDGESTAGGLAPAGLESADGDPPTGDVLTKPFSPRELITRVHAALGTPAERTPADGDADGPPVLRAGDLVVDLGGRRAVVGGRPVPLTGRELALLAQLVRHPGRTFGREELMEAVWGSRFGDRSTVTVHVRRLRAKLEVDPRQPQRIVTVWGVGYRFEP